MILSHMDLDVTRRIFKWILMWFDSDSSGKHVRVLSWMNLFMNESVLDQNGYVKQFLIIILW